MHQRMSLSKNKTVELWTRFMPQRHLIQNKIASDLFSMQVYDEGMSFDTFNEYTVFEKWAAVEIVVNQDLPAGVETHILPEGMYAVFMHRGRPSDYRITFDYIFGTWLPSSGYIVDNRPHFELLGAKYKNNDPDSEEEVWIPIRRNQVS
jgi:AraC family transcriptional regulator